MGVALLSDRHIQGEMQIVTDELPPPSLAYVVRRAQVAQSGARQLGPGNRKGHRPPGGLALAG